MREIANNAVHRRVKLATMAYAEVSTLDARFDRYFDDHRQRWTTSCDLTNDVHELRLRRQAGWLAALDVHGPECAVACKAHSRNYNDCDMIPVGYALLGGRCWKAVRDGLV